MEKWPLPSAPDPACRLLRLKRSWVSNGSTCSRTIPATRFCCIAAGAVYVYDLDGNRYLDLISGIGVNSLGHSHPRIVKVIRQQAGLLLHTSNLYYHEYQGRLAERLAKISGLQRSFFCNSGTEAMEGALKMIRVSWEQRFQPRRQKSSRSKTHSMAARWAQSRSPASPNTAKISNLCCLALASFRATTSPLWKPPSAIIRPALCSSLSKARAASIRFRKPFARKARELADRHNALLVFDEIQCGVGRPGSYFAYQLLDPVLLPDVVIAAKPMACGIPLGVIIANEKAAATIKPGMHGSTYGGGPLACRVALEFFDILDELLPSINSVGVYFRMKLTELMRAFPFIKEVRGQGLMIGVELDFPCKELVLDGIKEGILFNCTHDTVLRFLPPYILSEQDVDRAVAVLTKIFKNAKT